MIQNTHLSFVTSDTSLTFDVMSLENEEMADLVSYLQCFSPIDRPELMSTIGTSKPSKCLLDSILSRLFGDVLPLIKTSVLNQINLFLLTDVPQAFKVAVIKPLHKKPTLDPDILVNCKPFFCLQNA